MRSPFDRVDPLRPVPDGLTFVRQHPEMFRELAHDGQATVAILVEAALRGSSRWLEVRSINDCHMVSADTDWLAEIVDRDPFTEVIPFPELGPNAVHPEVVVAAFSSEMATVVGSQVRQIVGDGLILRDFDITLPVVGRCVIFRLRREPIGTGGVAGPGIGPPTQPVIIPTSRPLGS